MNQWIPLVNETQTQQGPKMNKDYDMILDPWIKHQWHEVDLWDLNEGSMAIWTNMDEADKTGNDQMECLDEIPWMNTNKNGNCGTRSLDQNQWSWTNTRCM